MTDEPLDLTAIEARVGRLAFLEHGVPALEDRRALLAEVKRLRAQLEALRRYRATTEGREYLPEETP